MVTTDAERQVSKLEANDRRRRSRAAKSAREVERLKRERDTVVRLSTRAIRHGFAFSLLQLDHRYWMLRACGWDILTAQYSRDADDNRCAPELSVLWMWWTGLHWRNRQEIRQASKFARRHA